MKSISFMMMLFLAGISLLACKESKQTDSAVTETAMGVITSDSLKMLREGLTQSFANIGGMIDQQIAATETALATADEAAKESLTRTLDQMKKVKGNLEAGVAKVKGATDETWTSIYQEIEPSLVEAKAILNERYSDPSASNKLSVSPKGVDQPKK